MDISIFTDPNYDFTNDLHKRNYSNTDLIDYNCGGAALLTFNAFIPYRDRSGHMDGVARMMQRGYSWDKTINIVLERDIKQMLNEFGGRLKLVNCNYELNQDERLIAYRIFLDKELYNIGISKYSDIDDLCEFIDSDFHFKFKDYNDKSWYQKLGFTEDGIVKTTVNNWRNGSIYYNSRTVFFCLKI